MFKLVIADDEGKTTVVPLVRDEISIGRAEGNTIRLTERNVSRRHAVLHKQGNAFVVEDLDSYNGVVIGGRRVQKEAPLQPGDEVRIGDYVIALHVDSTEVVPDGVSRPDSEPPLPPRLVMLTPPVPGAEFALSGEVMRLGRSEDLDIWINHRSISREHAEITREPDGSFRIADLGSANGIRLNGDEVEEALLEPYDVIKLGRVRLRYIPEGEAYVFDQAAESQGDEDADLGPGGSGSRAPMLMALGIIAVALVVGGAIIIYGSMPSAEADKQPVAPSIGPANTVDAPPKPSPTVRRDADVARTETPSPPATPEALVAACSQALKEGRFEDAVNRAADALAIQPKDSEAAACRVKGLAGVSFQRGYEALQQGDVDAAYFAFAEIPQGNPFRQHPAIAETAKKFADLHLQQANALLDKDPEEAMRNVDMVLDMTDAPAAETQQATKLRRVLRTRAGVTSAGKAAAGRPAPRVSPFDRALECARRGDNACVVAALDGKARTPQGLALLIETYRTMGQTKPAIRNMRLFVQRYPSDRRASRYKQFLHDH